jgi:hypothetical protein
MNERGEKKNIFNFIIIAILIIVVYIFVKKQIGYDLLSRYNILDEGIINFIGIVLIGFVAFLIIKSFIRMFSKNV